MRALHSCTRYIHISTCRKVASHKPCPAIDYPPNPAQECSNTNPGLHVRPQHTLSRTSSASSSTQSIAHGNARCTRNGPCNVPGCAQAASHGQCEHRQEREEEVHVQWGQRQRAASGNRLDATALHFTMPAHECLDCSPSKRPQLAQLPQQLAGLNARGAPSASTALSVTWRVTQL